MTVDRDDAVTLFITWTTYGTWLPGDQRGWKKRKFGEQPPQLQLESWCRQRMKGSQILLDPAQRGAVEKVIRGHSRHRGWALHAVSARTNHVHVAVTAVPAKGSNNYRPADAIKRVRDELKANSTRALRGLENPITRNRIWTRGGDIEFIETERQLEQVVDYILYSQDRMGADQN